MTACSAVFWPTEATGRGRDRNFRTIDLYEPCTDLAFEPDVRRVLIILSGDIDEPSLRSRCVGLASAGALALCYELPPENAGLEQTLRVQRHLTQLLRAAVGSAAETVPIFVAADREGERTGDFAEAWGATEVDS